jgi:hypothetical protein
MDPLLTYTYMAIIWNTVISETDDLVMRLIFLESFKAVCETAKRPFVYTEMIEYLKADFSINDENAIRYYNWVNSNYRYGGNVIDDEPLEMG